MHNVISQHFLRARCSCDEFPFVNYLPENDVIEDDWIFHTLSIQVPDCTLKEVKSIISKKNIAEPNIYMLNRVKKTVLIVYVLSKPVNKGHGRISSAYEKYLEVAEFLRKEIDHNCAVLNDSFSSIFSQSSENQRDLIISICTLTPYFLANIQRNELNGDEKNLQKRFLQKMAIEYNQSDYDDSAWIMFCCAQNQLLPYPLAENEVITIAKYIEQHNSKTRGKAMHDASAFRLGHHLVTDDERRKGGLHLNSQANILKYNKERDRDKGQRLILCKFYHDAGYPVKDIVEKIGISKKTYYRSLSEFEKMRDSLSVIAEYLIELIDRFASLRVEDDICTDLSEWEKNYLKRYYDDQYQFFVNPVFQGIIKGISDACQLVLSDSNTEVSVLQMFDKPFTYFQDTYNEGIKIIFERMITSHLLLFCNALCFFDTRLNMLREHFSGAFISPWVLHLNNEIFDVRALYGLVEDVCVHLHLKITCLHDRQALEFRYPMLTVKIEDRNFGEYDSCIVQYRRLSDWKQVCRDDESYIEAAMLSQYLDIPVLQNPQ